MAMAVVEEEEDLGRHRQAGRGRTLACTVGWVGYCYCFMIYCKWCHCEYCDFEGKKWGSMWRMRRPR